MGKNQRSKVSKSHPDTDNISISASIMQIQQVRSIYLLELGKAYNSSYAEILVAGRLFFKLFITLGTAENSSSLLFSSLPKFTLKIVLVQLLFLEENQWLHAHFLMDYHSLKFPN